jgi:hypothetical protein
MCTIDTDFEQVREHCGDNNCKDLTDLCLWVELDSAISTAVRFIGRGKTRNMVMRSLNSERIADIDAERTAHETRG